MTRTAATSRASTKFKLNLGSHANSTLITVKGSVQQEVEQERQQQRNGSTCDSSMRWPSKQGATLNACGLPHGVNLSKLAQLRQAKAGITASPG